MATGTTDTVRVSAIVPATPERVYGAWLDSREHSALTRSTATVEPWVGGRHSAWGGSIRGTTLELQVDRRIVQSWYASDFPPGSEDSRLEVLFERVEGGTLVTINHTGLPSGRGHRYEEGWKDFYLDRMKEYFTTHPEPPPVEESMAPIGRMSTMEPSAGTSTRPKAVAKKAAKARPAAKKTARAPKAKKASKRPTAKRKPAARKGTAKVRSKPARAARKTGARAASGRARARRSR
jgi:uncharacterized protein YndB with AHSA1/START domain